MLVDFEKLCVCQTLQRIQLLKGLKSFSGKTTLCISVCEHGRHLTTSLSHFWTKICQDTCCLSHQIPSSQQQMPVPSAFLGTSKNTWRLHSISVFLLHLLQGRWVSSWSQLGSLNAGLLYPLKVLWWSMCHSVKKVDGFWHIHIEEVWLGRPGVRGLEGVWQGAGEGGRGLSELKEIWQMELSHKFLTEPPPSFTDLLSQQGSGQQGSPWLGALMAWREKMFLVSFTLTDMITAAPTSCSCKKVLSSLRGGVRDDLWWVGFLSVLCVKIRKIFLSFSLLCCSSDCYMTVFKSYLKSQLTKVRGEKSLFHILPHKILFILR